MTWNSLFLTPGGSHFNSLDKFVVPEVKQGDSSRSTHIHRMHWLSVVCVIHVCEGYVKFTHSPVTG